MRLQNWGQSIPEVELAPLPNGLSRFPTRLSEVQAIVKDLSARYNAPGTSTGGPKPHLRVVGHGHSWTPIFADATGDWVIFSRDFEFDDGSNICGAGLAPDGAPLVRVRCPSVSETDARLASAMNRWDQNVYLSGLGRAFFVG